MKTPWTHTATRVALHILAMKILARVKITINRNANLKRKRVKKKKKKEDEEDALGKEAGWGERSCRLTGKLLRGHMAHSSVCVLRDSHSVWQDSQTKSSVLKIFGTITKHKL